MQEIAQMCKKSSSVKMIAQISAKHISGAQKIVNSKVKVKFAQNKYFFLQNSQAEPS